MKKPSLSRFKSTSTPTLEAVTTQTKKLPKRVVLHALEKWGKTSFAAQAPNPIFLMTRDEDGLATLIDSGQLPPVPHFPDPAETWQDLLLMLGELIAKEHKYRTLVLDTLNGAERLCHEYVCESEFNNDWGDRGFGAFGRGPKVSVAEFLELLDRLTVLRNRGMSIMLLCHSQIRTFRNPEGPDYDRWEPSLDKNTWGLVHKWADIILFGQFETFSEKETKAASKGKAQGGQTRLLMTERTAAYDAGNRYGLPPEIECGNSPEEAFQAFIDAMKKPK